MEPQSKQVTFLRFQEGKSFVGSHELWEITVWKDRFTHWNEILLKKCVGWELYFVTVAATMDIFLYDMTQHFLKEQSWLNIPSVWLSFEFGPLHFFTCPYNNLIASSSYLYLQLMNALHFAVLELTHYLPFVPQLWLMSLFFSIVCFHRPFAAHWWTAHVSVSSQARFTYGHVTSANMAG